MVVRGAAAPPAPWSRSMAQPRIDGSAYVHSFSNIVGDVHIQANVLIAPGTSIRADEGGAFYVGQGSRVQDGAIVHSLEQGRVVGDDGNDYSVWIGANATITHMALIHGPVYVGDNCFIGFRSTVFNARLGAGSIIMMHTLIQDVEIPPGKFVPSGAIITSQQQADRLPDVQPIDIEFVNALVGVGSASRMEQPSPVEAVAAADGSVPPARLSTPSTPSSQSSRPMYTTPLSPEVVDQVRHLLASGHRISTEHADARRFQTSSWQSCAPIHSTRDADVLSALAACMADHQGEYVRLVGIDTKNKRRVAEVIIQRPNGAASSNGRSPAPASQASHSYSAPAAAPSYGSTPTGRIAPEVVSQVRQLLSQGYQIGTEHADSRRFQTSSWQSCTPIRASRDTEVLSALEACLNEHGGEYVRLFGIDTRNKRRVSEIIVQRPNGKNGSAASASHGTSYAAPASAPASSGAAASYGGGGKLAPEVVNQVRQLLSQGLKVAAEHADTRRFQTSSWHSCAPIQSNREPEVLAALEACLAENAGEYVRLYGVDTQSKRRVSELIIQRP